MKHKATYTIYGRSRLRTELYYRFRVAEEFGLLPSLGQSGLSTAQLLTLMAYHEIRRQETT